MERKEAMLAEAAYIIDASLVLLCVPLIFWMQAGFSLLEAGSIRAKNTVNILLKNVMDISVLTPIWYLIGYGLAFGEGNSFIGGSKFFGLENSEYIYFLFQWAFCSTSVTIVSGATAERIQFPTYLCFSIFMTIIVYPPICHWIWSGEGWLAKEGMLDFAGSGVVHTTGGVAALVATIFLKPRIGRFGVKNREITGHSITLSSLGVWTLWFGWFAFNCGSSLALSGRFWVLSSQALLNTLISPATAAFVSLCYHFIYYRTFHLVKIMNACLAGLAAITAPCAFVEVDAGVLIGIWASVFYEVASAKIESSQIDDPLDAFSVHGVGGLWGLVAVGLFAEKSLVDLYKGEDHHTWGLFYGGGWELLGVQILGGVCIVVWVICFCAPFFYVARALNRLRISLQYETQGMDRTIHTGAAYAPLEEKISTWVGTRVSDLSSI